MLTYQCWARRTRNKFFANNAVPRKRSSSAQGPRAVKVLVLTNFAKPMSATCTSDGTVVDHFIGTAPKLTLLGPLNIQRKKEHGGVPGGAVRSRTHQHPQDRKRTSCIPHEKPNIRDGLAHMIHLPHLNACAGGCGFVRYLQHSAAIDHLRPLKTQVTTGRRLQKELKSCLRANLCHASVTLVSTIYQESKVLTDNELSIPQGFDLFFISWVL